MNNFTGIGRLGRDPETKTLDSGTVLTNFSIAINRRFKDKNGEYPTDWLNVTAFGKTAEFIAKYFKKGDSIGIVGSVQTRKYTDKNGYDRTATDIVAEQAHFTGSKKEQRGDAWEPTQSADVPTTAEDELALPFDL